MNWNNELKKAIDAHRDAILAFTEDLIRIPSENPPGNSYQACIQRIAMELERLDLPSRIVKTPGFDDHPRMNLLSHWGDGRTLWFHGHCDVVPAQDPQQFRPRVQNWMLHGRGSADMKSGLAAMIYATYLLKHLGAPIRGRIGLCVVVDEETGGQGGSRYLQEMGLLGKDGIAMLTPEPSSGVIWNANRGTITLRITAIGKPAHVGLQHQGVNAFERMVDIVKAVQSLKSEVEQRKTAYRITPSEAAYSILMLGGRVDGGTNFNVVPERCSFTLERRFNPEEDFATEKARLFDLLNRLKTQGLAMEVEILQETPSSGVSEDHPMAKALAETIAGVTGKCPPFEMCPGSLEIRWYAQAGIPAFAYGPGLLEVAHGPKESVNLNRVYESTLICALYAMRLLA